MSGESERESGYVHFRVCPGGERPDLPLEKVMVFSNYCTSERRFLD